MSMYSVLFGSKAAALNAGIEGIAEARKTMGTPGKGMAIGLAAMAAGGSVTIQSLTVCPLAPAWTNASGSLSD